MWVHNECDPLLNEELFKTYESDKTLRYRCPQCRKEIRVSIY